MACLKDSPYFNSEKNDYYTTKEMWQNISHIIPKNKIIFEACLLNSNSKSIEYLKELGFNVVGNNTIDCLNEVDFNFDMIITNIPFKTDIKKKILKKFVDIDKPFITIINVMNVYSSYFREIFGDNIKYLQIISPKGKIKFEIYDKELKQLIKCKTDPSFYCVYLCYKMNLENKDLWLK